MSVDTGDSVLINLSGEPEFARFQGLGRRNLVRSGHTEAAVLDEPRSTARRNRHSPSNHRPLDVLVLDSEFRQALAATRSFASAGFVVGGAACRAHRRDALALRSRWCRYAAFLPDFSEDAGAYCEAVLALLQEQPAAVLLPCHDGSISALRARRAEVEGRTALALASEAALDIASDKSRTLALARSVGVDVPASYTVESDEDLRNALDEVGYPAVLKPMWSWVHGAAGGSRLSCSAVQSFNEALRSLDAIHEAGGHAVVQQWLSGRRDAVTLMVDRGGVRARFAQTSYRELPALGGSSVFFESIPPLKDIVEPAERLVRAMHLEGCSMVEFRRDRTGRPLLMEVNARMGGSVSLAISAGVDFPLLIRAWALGRYVPDVLHYRVGVRRRWLAGDVDHLKDALKGSDKPDVPSRAAALATFVSDFITRPSAFEVYALADMRPGLIEFRQTIRSAVSSVGRLWRRMSTSQEATDRAHA